jgi:hypothetical protein
MAARLELHHPEEVRAKIRTSQLLNRLMDHALGKIEMTKTQVSACMILLRKTLPDLMAISHSGSVELTKPEDLTDVALANIASGSRNRVTEAPSGQTEPSELH